MSVTRLLVCGLLVASGLTLAAFTLHGAFDARQVQASGGPALKPWSTSTVGAKPGARPSVAAPDAKASRKKRRTQKRPAEPTQRAKPQPQQTASQWPWTWFGN